MFSKSLSRDGVAASPPRSMAPRRDNRVQDWSSLRASCRRRRNRFMNWVRNRLISFECSFGFIVWSVISYASIATQVFGFNAFIDIN